MAPPYSNGYGYSSSALPTPSYDYRSNGDFQSICDDIFSSARSMLDRLLGYANGRRRHTVWGLAMKGMQQVRRNMTRRRLLSFPHLLVALWVLVMLWGERWVFASRVRGCDWDHWEDWPAGATPHRLIFVADPQIIDPKSYPGRPWPLNPLTVTITDNYMRRSYKQLQKLLHPDTVFFLGDLFDGGREWKTAHGNFDDPEWAKGNRPADEAKYLNEWHRKYGEEFWLQEYERFGNIFYDNWNLGGVYPGPGQRGRKLISSLPGNHDLGFGAEVKVTARHRFNAYFGETNRVDVIGNHTFVSVDTVSLSADTSSMKDRVDLEPIYGPAQEFLKSVKATKRRAAEKEVLFWKGAVDDLAFDHKVEDLSNADYSNLPTMDLKENAPDFPTILLTHVPLFRDPGTPCGPLREHWPPAKPPKGQTTPVIPDHRNAISVSSGYQYQNVLSPEDSVKLIKSIGNVIHAFSGDDHDYCEVVHTPDQESVREITVKSISMAMGVPTPGFQMVSLYNPIDERGNPLPGAPKTTLQTHLCLLPQQLSTFMTYAVLGILTLVVLIARAFLVPVLRLQPFALDPVQNASSAVLPIFKAKTEGDDGVAHDVKPTSSNTSSSKFPSARVSSARTRGQSLSNGLGLGLGPQARAPSPNSARGKAGSPGGKWGWGQNRGPRIEIRRDAYYGGGGSGSAADRGGWRPASSRGSRSTLGLVGREIWTTSWRVAWMVLGFFAWLTYKG
ncbi:glucose transporter [Hypoxylon texense]